MEIIFLTYTKNLQITALVFLILTAALAAFSIIEYHSFLVMRSPSLQGCDSCLRASEISLTQSTVAGIFASIFAVGCVLAFMMDRKREYLKAHGYL